MYSKCIDAAPSMCILYLFSSFSFFSMTTSFALISQFSFLNPIVFVTSLVLFCILLGL